MISKSFQEKSEKAKFPEQTIINALLLGSKAVGKTTIGQRLAGKFYNNILLAETYGIDFHFLNLKHETSNIFVQIWDVNFQNYENNCPGYFIEKADVLLLVIDGKDSFEELKKYKTLIHNSNAKLKYLIWNKIDIPQENLYEKQLEAFTRKHTLQLFRISALMGTHFEEFNRDFKNKLRVLSKRKE